MHNTSKLKTAIDLHQTQHLDEATHLYQEILETDPTHEDALRLLCSIQCQKEQYQAAITLLRNALTINSQVIDWHFNLGVILHTIKHHEEALS